jgi:D-tyrosyl-tRNA(Tyr) deacylase
VRAVVQRVSEASVEVEDEPPRAIGPGIVILLGITEGDGEYEARWMAEKCAHLRIFNDAGAKMNLSLLDVDGEALVVSQFTLYGDAGKGRRPSFVRAAGPETADPLYRRTAALLQEAGVRRVATGTFGAHMRVKLVGDGPVTLILDAPGTAS